MLNKVQIWYTKKMSSFYENGLKFECQRCSFCCGHSPGYVYLSYRDLDELCKFFGMSREDFIEKNCRWVEYYYGETVLALKEKTNYDCWLWENGCSAYSARPIQCSTYPFWTWMIKDEQMWNECAKDCPGMNKGKTWPVQKIEEQKKLYSENIPIKKDEFYSKEKESESSEDNSQ